ncbi:MAG: ABC transporter substrate-binding protein [Rubrimonas sp.]
MIRHVLAAALALTPLTAAADGPSGRLVLYTSQPNADAQATVDAFMAAHPAVTVDWVRDGTTQLMAKLRAEFEAGAPQPDVLLIADSVTMEALKAEGRLMAHPDADVSAYDPALMDPDRHWFSTKLITTGIAYNTAAPIVPESYRDVIAPEAAAAFMMPSPLTSGAATIHMVSIAENPALGWEIYEQLGENGAVASGGNGGVLNAIASGEKLYGFLVDFMAIREAAKGAPVGFVFPTEGVSAVTEPVAILSTAQNPEAAKAFVDFLISVEGQQVAAEMGYMPAHPGVTPPEGFPALADIAILPFDPARALAEDEANKKKFADIFEN